MMTEWEKKILDEVNLLQCKFCISEANDYLQIIKKEIKDFGFDIALDLQEKGTLRLFKHYQDRGIK